MVKTALQISLPNNWNPRPDQMAMWGALENGCKKVDVVAHRRWGKDDVSLHWAATMMHQKIGTYWHMLPEAAQARKAIWDAINPRTGKRRIDEAFPKELRASTREQDMMIRMKCGSTWQVVGSDNYNSLVGSPPICVVFSEWALADPAAYAYIRPILLENGGVAIFIWTPRGRNHATRAFEARERDASWFTMRMPATQTSVFTPEQLEAEKQSIIDEMGSEVEGEAKFNQEYMVDFDAATPGAYYALHMSEAQSQGRICQVPYDDRFPVDTAWDLGIDDYTAIWYLQRVSPRQINVINYYETSDVGLGDLDGRPGIVTEAFVRMPYKKWGLHYLPHDVMVRELGAGGRSRKETLFKLGVRPIRVGIQRNPEDRINAVRRALPYMHFDAANTEVGRDHLKQYRKKWNKSLGIFGGPLHNEASHASDALGEFAVNAHLPVEKNPANERTGKPGADGYSKTHGTRSMFGRKVPHWKVA